VYTDRRLRKDERLNAKKAIDLVFAKGKMVHSGAISAKYLNVEEGTGTIRIMITVPKKKFKKAVSRNLLKRRIREAYRLLKPTFTGAEIGPNTDLHLALIYNTKQETTFVELSENLSTIFSRIFETKRKTNETIE
jgi:ribonuclease P protein component